MDVEVDFIEVIDSHRSELECGYRCGFGGRMKKEADIDVDVEVDFIEVIDSHRSELGCGYRCGFGGRMKEEADIDVDVEVDVGANRILLQRTR